jgi:hypothetical protein
MDSTAPRPLHPRERVTVPVLHEVGLAFVLVWTDAKDFAPNGFRSPDRPPPSESLNRLRWPGPVNSDTEIDIQIIPYWIKSTCWFLPSHARCATAIVFNPWAIKAKTGVPFQARQSDTCGGQSGNGTGIQTSDFALPCQYHSTFAPHSFNHLPSRYGGPNLATDNTVSSTQ